MHGNRRTVLRLVLGALAGLPALVAAQQRAQLPRVGFLYFGTRQSALDSGRYAAFLEGMRKQGYVPGRDFVLDERFAESRRELVPPLARELVQLEPRVIVATGSPTYRVLRDLTSTIPIVITVSVDPVAEKFAASLARPGGNFTGLTDTASALGPKHIELLVTTVPSAARIAVLTNPDNTSHPRQYAQAAAEAQRIGRQTLQVEARSVQEIEVAFARMAKERAGGMIMFGDTFFAEQVRTVADHALRNRVPAVWTLPDFVRAGGLMSYGPDIVDNFRSAAVYVERILKGAKAGELPFEQAGAHYLNINLRTARTIGVTIPPTLLVRADKLIE
jgi:putative ABC transport system substrate-binding protein